MSRAGNAVSADFGKIETMDLEQFLREELLSAEFGPLLVVAGRLPAVFAEYPGPLTFIGFAPPENVVRSRDYVAMVRRDEGDLLASLENYARGCAMRFSLVYLDTDHRIETLVRQINSVTSVIGPSTLFVFPGAVPPRRSVGTSIPSEAWWTGDVWTLASILPAAGATIHTFPADPVGVLFAAGVTRIDRDDASRATQLLQANTSQDEFDAFFRHTPLQEIGPWVHEVLGIDMDVTPFRILFDEQGPAIVRSHIIDEPFEWQRPPPRFAYDLSDGDGTLDFLFKGQRPFPGVRLDEFENVLLHGRDLVLGVSRDDRSAHLYPKNYTNRYAMTWAHQISREPISDSDIATALYREGDEVFIGSKHIRQPERIDGPVFLATPDEFYNYGMYLLYCVPGIPVYQRIRGDYPKVLATMIAPWQRQMLLDLGVDEQDLIHHRYDQCYAVSTLAMVRYGFRSLGVSASDRDAFDALGERAVAALGGSPERIYISRMSKTKAGGHRVLLNEGALIERLESLGFVAVEPERHRLLGQAQLFRNARVVIGVGGAAMFNVAFCRPGTFVVDIESTTGFVDTHCNLFASRGVDYGVIVATGETPLTDADVHRPWTVDVERVAGIIAPYL